MSKDLPRGLPSGQHLDPAALLAFIDAVEADPAIELHALMVLRHGHVVAEGWWAPHTPGRTRLLYSLSKSFTSTALGFALSEGLLDLDDTVVSHYPEFDADITDPGSRSITLRHVASMASGHNREMIEQAQMSDPQNLVRGFLLVPPDEQPGTVFAYSQPCTYTVASIIQRAAGMRLTEYLRPRLLDPLGIGEVGWQADPPGQDLGFSGLFARTEDIAKLGQLYLQRGRWDDTQLLPGSYIAQATSRQIDTADQEDNLDWRQGYGFGFWVSQHGYRGDGAFGQFCLVLPEQNAVVAITGGTETPSHLLDAVWRHLLPGLGSAGSLDSAGFLQSAESDDAAQQELDTRLAGLRLAPCVGRPSPPRWQDWCDAPISIALAAESDSGTPLIAIQLSRTDQGLEITLLEPANTLTFSVGAADWLVSTPRDGYGDAIPVAASGGWLDDHTLRVEVIFLESPHRMDITATLPSHAAEATWRQPPLHGGKLQTLHRPK